MSANKNAQLRYQILDRCFSNFHQRYTIDDLVEEVNDKLYDLNGTAVSLRQIREDIKFMRDSVGFNAPIEAYPLEGRKCYYRYADRNFTIFNNELSVEEVRNLSQTVSILRRFRGMPSYGLQDLPLRTTLATNSVPTDRFHHCGDSIGSAITSQITSYKIVA